MTAMIEVQQVGFGYTGGAQLFESLSFALAPGTFTGIAGPNGAGKTTLLKLLCGLLRAQSGEIMIDGKRVARMKARALAEKVAVVRQQTQTSFEFTVLETVLMARMHHLDWRGFERSQDREIVNDALHMTETVHLANRTLHHLSGGEQQRVFIARALAQGTDVLLLDEPTTHLDLRHQVATYDLLKQAQHQQHKTVVAITHDINMAMQYCDTVMLLSPTKSLSDEHPPSTQDQGYSRLFIGSPEEVFVVDRIEEAFGVRVHVMEAGGRTFFTPHSRYVGPRSPEG